MDTPSSRASSPSLVVEGPGMDSAKSKRRRSSRWQKYWARNNSGRQTMFASLRAASRIWRRAESKFDSGSGPMLICTRPILYLRALVISLVLHKQGQPRRAELASFVRQARKVLLVFIQNQHGRG